MRKRLVAVLAALLTCPGVVSASTLIALLLVVLPVQAQVTNLMPVPRIQFFNSSGVPLANGKLFSYISGTTTAQATYTDSTGGTPNANPVILDAGGFASIWLTPGLTYTIVLKSSSDVQQWSVDNVNSDQAFVTSCQVAEDAFGSNPGLVTIPSTYTGANCSAVSSNVVILDLRAVAAVAGTTSQSKYLLYSGNSTPLNDIGGLFPSFPRRSLLLVQDEIADSGGGSSGVTESAEDAIQGAIRTLDPHKDVVAFYGQCIVDVATDGGGCWGANVQAIGGGGLDTKLSGLELDTSSQLFLPVNISAISRSSNVVTVDTAAAHGLSVSDTIYVGATTGSTDFKGTFQVAGVTDSDTFTYNQTAADDTGTGGDVRKMGLGTESKSGLLINAFNNEISEAILIGGGDLTRGIFRNGLNFVAKSMNPFSGALFGAQTARYNNGIDLSQATFNGEAIILRNTEGIQFKGTASNHGLVRMFSDNFLQIVGGTGGTVIRNQSNTVNNLLINDNGAITIRAALTVSSSITSGGGANPETLTIKAVDAIVPGASGSNLLLNAGDGDSDPTLGGIGGDVIVTAGDGQTVGNRRGGDVVLDPGAGVGSARNGRVSIENGVNEDGGGFKHTRIASGTTGGSLHDTASATWTFGTAFADTSYTITCTVDNPTGVPIVANTNSKAAGSIDIVIMAGSAAAASGTLNCIAVHD